MFSWFGRTVRGQSNPGLPSSWGKTDEERESDELKSTRKISVCQEIDDEYATTIIAKMLFLQHVDSQKNISIDIRSPGGNVVACFAICDTIEFVSCPVATHCSTLAGGIAALLLAAGERGQRSMNFDAAIVFAPLSRRDGSNDDYIRTYAHLVGKFAELTGQSCERIRADMEAYRKFDAMAAHIYGLVDEIQGDADQSPSESVASPLK